MHWMSLYPKFITVPARTEIHGYYNDTEVAQLVRLELPCGGSLATDNPDEAREMLKKLHKEQCRVALLPDTKGPMPFDLEKALYSMPKIAKIDGEEFAFTRFWENSQHRYFQLCDRKGLILEIRSVPLS